MTEPFLSIVIPAYNEAARIGKSLERVAAFLSQQPYTAEVLVVDDGSSDGTQQVVNSQMGFFPSTVVLRLLAYHPNRGKGAAVRWGCRAAAGKYVLYTDADLPTPIQEAEKLLAALAQGNDLAIGSRIQPGGHDMRASQPFYRRMLGKLYVLVVGLVATRGIPDTQCGFKAFTRDAAQLLFPAQQLEGWVFDTELLYLAQRWGLRIAQVPVSWANVGGSRMRVTFGQALRILWDLLSIRLRHRADAKAPDRLPSHRL